MKNPLLLEFCLTEKCNKAAKMWQPWVKGGFLWIPVLPWSQTKANIVEDRGLFPL